METEFSKDSLFYTANEPAEVAQLKKISSKEITPEFPIGCFPDEFIEMITAMNKDGKPIDNIALYYMGVLSVAIGNSVCVSSWDNAWRCMANLFTLAIDFSGSNKTGMQKAAEYPIGRIESYLLEGYQGRERKYHEDWKQYQRENKEKPKEEQESAVDLKRSFELEGNYPPKLEYFKTSQTTMEALFKNLSGSPRGILWSRDEFRGLLAELGAYKNGLGSDFENVLELHSCGNIVIDRVTGQSLRITKPFVTLNGGMQPELIPVMFEDKFVMQGFPQRFMMIFPKMTEEKTLSLDDIKPKEVYQAHNAKWGDFIYDLYTKNEYKDDSSRELSYSMESKKYILEWLNSFKVKMINTSANSTIRSFASKLDYYVYKCAILLHTLHNCLHHSSDRVIPKEISLDTVKKACVLSEYFAAMWFKVYRVHLSMKNFTALTGKRKELYIVLPKEFKATKAVSLAEDNEIMKSKAVYNFLKDMTGVYFTYDADTKLYTKSDKIDHEEQE